MFKNLSNLIELWEAGFFLVNTWTSIRFDDYRDTQNSRGMSGDDYDRLNRATAHLNGIIEKQSHEHRR